MSYPFDLGTWSRKITTTSQEAQTWFDRGLNWTYGYNQEEAVTCFRQALTHDPGCAMAWWGIAYAAGPFYNRPWIRFTDAEVSEILPICHAAAQSAGRLKASCTSEEKGLIEAIAQRYQTPVERHRNTLNQWQEDFTASMRSVHQANPNDLDIAALFAEAAVTCTPRQLWNLKTGGLNPASHAEEALNVLEEALATAEARNVRHPGLLHMYIHALEMSPFPERALSAADKLIGIAPDAGHMEHMPAHIYVLCGNYEKSLVQGRRAIMADDKYLAYAGADNFYTTARCHDLHLQMFTAMFLGQYEAALRAADKIRSFATPELLDKSAPFMASILDGYSAMRTHVQVRFGKWRELTLTPPPADPERFPITAAMHAYGKGVAHAAIGEVDEAELAREAFQTACEAISSEAIFLSNPVHDMLGVGAAMLDGELSYRRGDFENAFDHLRLAVARDDALNYTEPWAWMHPPRHALGALLAEQGRYEEATAVFKADLGYSDTVPRCCQHPGNVWALHGLLECVQKTGDIAEAKRLTPHLDAAMARTDVPIRAACCCRTTA